MIKSIVLQLYVYSPRDSSLLKHSARPKGLKMVSESKFCAKFENPFLSCRTRGFKAPERGYYPTPHLFPNVSKIKYIPITSKSLEIWYVKTKVGKSNGDVKFDLY